MNIKRVTAIAGFAIMIIGLGSFGPTPGAFSSASSPGTPASFPGPASHTASPSFLVISDIHLHAEYDQSPAITKNSDSGKDLWDSAEIKIRSVLSGEAGFGKPKFIIYLGDLPWHAKDS